MTDGRSVSDVGALSAGGKGPYVVEELLKRIVCWRTKQESTTINCIVTARTRLAQDNDSGLVIRM